MYKNKIHNHEIKNVQSMALSSNGQIAFLSKIGNPNLFCYSLKNNKLKCKSFYNKVNL